jgi:hypothetical protein
MDCVELEVFSTETNAAIVRMPGRRFPGMVIQGDSLAILQQRASGIAALLSRGNLDEAHSEAAALASSLDECLLTYERVLADHGMDLPYSLPPRHLRT